VAAAGNREDLLGVLRNPEHEWERPTVPAANVRAEVERRIGPTAEPLTLLGGGLKNLNVRVGQEHVLRIHRDGTTDVAKEAALLRWPWRSFVVPPLLAAGDDYLLLGHVAHERVPDDAAAGAAVGRALAEIHARSYPTAGFLDAELAVREPFGDSVTPFYDFAWSCGRVCERALGAELAGRVYALLDAQLEALQAHSGAPVRIHSDFKVSNLHWTADGQLLVLDWESSYAGTRLCDLAQLMRWSPPAPFVDAFVAEYRSHGGELPDDWQHWAALLDLCNLVGALDGNRDSQRVRDLCRRIEETVAEN
jgi:aminoglycoside phosphotransferase (APT) family kinase protein